MKRLTLVLIATMTVVAVAALWWTIDSPFSSQPECVQGAPVDGECAP